jgi:hypothetical protein
MLVCVCVWGGGEVAHTAMMTVSTVGDVW